MQLENAHQISDTKNSVRSKRFRASSSRKLGREQKKEWRGSKKENYAARKQSWSPEAVDHNEDDLGVQSPEQIPLPDSEDELGAARSTVADNIQPAEEGLGTNRPKRVKKPSHKVIENKLVEIENQLEIQ